eukprot:gene2322-biopygen1008
MSTIWSIGATEGLKKLFLGHALVGLMYVLLAVCFAELTSVVPFAGGSFGFCRAALGPFWGFMVGASEVLENIMKVHKNLPRALVLGTLFSYGLIFWVVVTVVCVAPGFLYPPAWIANPYSFTMGFIQMFDRPDLWYLGALFSIVPLFASALTFMWGCGYQVASLARSGLVPSVFATTYGENETPVVALGVSALVQFLMCLGNQRTGELVGITTCYRAMMIGATFVYIGMFTSFIVFRTNFSGMKRHWVSPVGIPGALVGLGMALILCIAVIILEPYRKAVKTYFVFMACAMLYYVLYARHTQYFSKEEQKHFLKAYIVNANNAKTKTKQKTAQQKAMAMFAPISQMFGLPTAAFSRSNGGASSASMAPSGRTSSHAPVASISKHNTVAPAPASLGVEIVESPSKVDAEVRVQEPSRSTEAESLATSTTVRSARPQNVPLRASWAAGAGSTKVSWSGKAMTMTESKKFLEVLMSAPEDVTGQLVESLPNQFVALGVDEAAMASARVLGQDDGGLEEERELCLGEIVEGALGDDADTNEPVA